MATATKPAAKKTVKSAEKTAENAHEALSGMSTDAFKSFETMTAAAREQFEGLMSNMTGQSEEWRETAEEVIAEMRERFETSQKHFAEINAEIVDGAKTEMADAVQFASDLGKAKSLNEAFSIQQDYFRNLFETRSERMQSLTDKSVAAAKETMTPVDADMTVFFDTSAIEKMFRFPGAKA